MLICVTCSNYYCITPGISPSIFPMTSVLLFPCLSACTSWRRSSCHVMLGSFYHFRYMLSKTRTIVVMMDVLLAALHFRPFLNPENLNNYSGCARKLYLGILVRLGQSMLLPPGSRLISCFLPFFSMAYCVLFNHVSHDSRDDAFPNVFNSGADEVFLLAFPVLSVSCSPGWDQNQVPRAEKNYPISHCRWVGLHAHLRRSCWYIQAFQSTKP